MNDGEGFVANGVVRRLGEVEEDGRLASRSFQKTYDEAALSNAIATVEKDPAN